LRSSGQGCWRSKERSPASVRVALDQHQIGGGFAENRLDRGSQALDHDIRVALPDQWAEAEVRRQFEAGEGVVEQEIVLPGREDAM
jgi:hypothetical protein